MEFLNLNVSNLQDVILFLLPGFLAIYLFYFQIPDRKKSDLTIIVLSVAASLALTYITSLLFTLVNLIFQTGFTMTRDVITFGWTRIGISILVSILLARFVRSRVFAAINKKIFNVQVYPFGRLWNVFFSVDKKTVVKVFLTDGASYIGRVSKASNDPDDEVQEIELLDPFYFDRKKAKFKRIEETESVLIQGNAITTIEKINDESAKQLYKFFTPKKEN